jgi:hypothetical protein
VPQVVKDSIRRDREALFGATRQVSAVTNSHHPSIYISAHVLAVVSPPPTQHPTRTPATRNGSTRYAQCPSKSHPACYISQQAIPTIDAGGADSDGSSSDGELPIFFTTTDADADFTPVLASNTSKVEPHRCYPPRHRHALQTYVLMLPAKSQDAL